MTNPIDTKHTMTVTIRDRSAEAPWGVGPTSPAVRTVTISALCPECGAPRGKPSSLRQHDDGCTYYVDIWTNPCGHHDMYEDVAVEARSLAAAPALPPRPDGLPVLLVVDADCPSCGKPERTFDPARGVFGCSSLGGGPCGYESTERNA